MSFIAASTYKGVYFSKSKSRWIAQMFIKGKLKCIGQFYTEVEAAKAYDKVLLENIIATRLNFPDSVKLQWTS